MKAITLYQPWATLIACGAKKFETRHWKTSYRGNIAIHASKRWTSEEKSCYAAIFRMYPHLQEHLSEMPFGAVICACKLHDVIPVELIRHKISKMERDFGNYNDRRFAFELEVVKLPSVPILARGEQGIWEWNPDR